MNSLLFGALSFGLLGAASIAGPEMIDASQISPAHVQTLVQTVEFRVEPADVAVVQTRPPTQAERDAADDAEFARLMEAAPDVGTFGESEIADPETGVVTRVSSFGFSDN